MTPELDPATYARLRTVAARIADRGAHLQATELLHEAWEKLARSETVFESRGHFLAVASRAMRQILVNDARDRAAQKRGGDRRRTTISGLGQPDQGVDLLALDQVLKQLEAQHPDAARVVELRVFGGCTVAETAEVLQSSERSVSRSWRFARAFLQEAMGA